MKNNKGINQNYSAYEGKPQLAWEKTMKRQQIEKDNSV